MEKVIFSYRLRYDTGFAPCLDNNIFTLVCCKGGQVRGDRNIRTGLRYKIGKYHDENPENDIFLLGIFQNTLLYYAKITEIMSMMEYYSLDQKARFGNRMDGIYDVIDGELSRNELLPEIHPKGDKCILQDINGVYALISSEFTYFGNRATKIPENILSVLPQNREHKCYDSSNEVFYRIHDFAMGRVGTFQGKIGEPHHSLLE